MGIIKTTLPQRVTVAYKVLPEIFGTPEDEFEYIPEQIEITEVKLEILSIKSNKLRSIHILDSLSPAEILHLEDEVMAQREQVKRNYHAKQHI